MRADAPVVVELEAYGRACELLLRPTSTITRLDDFRCSNAVQEVTMRAGAPVVVDDLIEAYEKVYGPLPKFSASIDTDAPDYTWKSSPEGAWCLHMT